MGMTSQELIEDTAQRISAEITNLAESLYNLHWQGDAEYHDFYSESVPHQLRWIEKARKSLVGTI